MLKNLWSNQNQYNTDEAYAAPRPTYRNGDYREIVDKFSHEVVRWPVKLPKKNHRLLHAFLEYYRTRLAE